MKKLSLKSLFSKKRGDDHVHPVRDWLVILAVALAVLVLSALWNFWLFIQLANGKALSAVQPAQQQASQTSVTNVQDVFKARSTEKLNYQNTYHFVDPSK